MNWELYPSLTIISGNHQNILCHYIVIIIIITPSTQNISREGSSINILQILCQCQQKCEPNINMNSFFKYTRISAGASFCVN